MENSAKKLQNDPTVYEEEPFNAQKTWIEYVNRLFGFLAGNFMLAAFFGCFLPIENQNLYGYVDLI